VREGINCRNKVDCILVLLVSGCVFELGVGIYSEEKYSNHRICSNFTTDKFHRLC
jgi:hypothetical protein